MIKDGFGRPITSMRVSITSRCNFSCRYCHHEGMAAGSENEMTPEEIREIVAMGVRFGVKKVKITGGEPLVRKDVVDVIDRVSSIEGITDLSITTNGYYLEDYASDLKKAGLDRVNVSLDTLRPDVFKWITGSDTYETVIKGIDAALEAELTPLKINVVVMKGINDNEINSMLKSYSGREVIVQLIELVKSDSSMFRDYYFDLDNIEDEFRKRALEVHERRFMHGRRQYLLNGATVEIIKPMHNSYFCAHCTRLRVTSDGEFKPCLMRNDNHVDFLKILRSGVDKRELEKLFVKAVMRREPFFKPGSKERDMVELRTE
ncbi:cyclic pyranopterin monophosphate synthase [archaeon BMS3Bbin15]|nr:cyclic pyranopterin monophosphate synthase [archaeon BMS3Bbin15]